MHLNMVSFTGLMGSSTSIADIHTRIYIYVHTKPQIEHDYLPHANALGNNPEHIMNA